MPADTPETIEQIRHILGHCMCSDRDHTCWYWANIPPDGEDYAFNDKQVAAITTHIEAAYERGQYEANMDIVGCPGTASQIRDYACHMAAKHNHKEPQRHE